jgi:hypothetical protein
MPKTSGATRALIRADFEALFRPDKENLCVKEVAQAAGVQDRAIYQAIKNPHPKFRLIAYDIGNGASGKHPSFRILRRHAIDWLMNRALG